eukprot:scaffold7567_cov515-Pinguiococcus_pyrenoidosus.AAC.1
MDGRGSTYSIEVGCEGLSQARDVDPGLRLMPTDAGEDTAFFDPTTPPSTGTGVATPAFSVVDQVPDDDFFEQRDYMGAF